MRNGLIGAAAFGVLRLGAGVPALALDRGHVETFAVLPAGASGPEGLTVGADGNVYVTTFGFNAQGSPAFRTLDSQWTDQVQRYTVSALQTKLKPLGH